jgi:hypothetical protein
VSSSLLANKRLKKRGQRRGTSYTAGRQARREPIDLVSTGTPRVRQGLRRVRALGRHQWAPAPSWSAEEGGGLCSVAG